MKKIFALLITFIVFSPVVISQYNSEVKTDFLIQKEFLGHNTILNKEQYIVIIPDSDPFFGIISTSIACWYDIVTNKTGLLPYFIQHDGNLTEQQQHFIDISFKLTNCTQLILGDHLNTNYPAVEILGSAVEVANACAIQFFSQASTVLIIPYYSDNAYQLSLIAAPLASYLNSPILIFNNSNQEDIQSICKSLHTSSAYVIGDINISLMNINMITLKNIEEIQHKVLTVIKEVFREINYITITNPSDVIPCYTKDIQITTINDQIKNLQVTLFGKTMNLKGNDTKKYTIQIPDGINHVKINGILTKKSGDFLDTINPIVPLLFMFLYDPQGKIVAYSNSLAYDNGKTYLETLTCNASGNYTLVIRGYNGIKGGYFIQRGISNLNANIIITTSIKKLEKPHLPLIPKLSMTAPYLTAAHGGIIIIDDNELTNDSYSKIADGSGTGPWYNESLQNFNNDQVNKTVDQINETIKLLAAFNLLTNYLSGPSWLAIIGDTNMIPMYYYGPSQQDLAEKGLPSDNPYSLQEKLSTGRIVGWNLQDVSLLIAKTFFYQTICGKPNSSNPWFTRFSFIFGEGFGETGGIFHQIPYAQEIKKYGFDPRVYGDFRNSRQITTLLKTFTNANYIEYIGHSDWFWLTPSIYGLDTYSRAIDVAHVKHWTFEKPAIFLTSACLMGRIDGIPSEMNIGLCMLHAGCNGFIGATRETGQEAGLTTLENHLIVDDLSIGEALRGEKRIDKEIPTYYVRTLYGDPAFNPYEPLNGFHDQGRPILKF